LTKAYPRTIVETKDLINEERKIKITCRKGLH